MFAKIKLISLLPLLSIPALHLASCTTIGVPAAQAKSSQTVNLAEGQVLQLIAPEARPDGQQARQAYYQSAFPIAESLGYERHAQLNVRQKVASDYDPGAFLFFSWPGEKAAEDFAQHPDWPTLKATRPQAWSELKIYNKTLEDDLSLEFHTSKHYSVVIAWFNPEKPGDYDKYLNGIEPAVERAGGRFIYKMRNPSFEAHASPLEGPDQITFVEWETTDGFATVQGSDEYKAHAKYFGSGLKKFEFYWLKSQ